MSQIRLRQLRKWMVFITTLNFLGMIAYYGYNGYEIELGKKYGYNDGNLRWGDWTIIISAIGFFIFYILSLRGSGFQNVHKYLRTFLLLVPTIMIGATLAWGPLEKSNRFGGAQGGYVQNANVILVSPDQPYQQQQQYYSPQQQQQFQQQQQQYYYPHMQQLQHPPQQPILIGPNVTPQQQPSQGPGSPLKDLPNTPSEYTQSPVAATATSGYQLSPQPSQPRTRFLSQQIKRVVPGLAVVAVRIILDGPQAEEVLKSEKADLVAGGRTFLRHPNFALNAARELNVKAAFSQQYSRGRTIHG
ncbi:hypothetical protein BGX30_013644 [Mortierella sp. GBA39]|nr:hypothetical protein BGX30_013644 [Mortierella sp. GBA39]